VVTQPVEHDPLSVGGDVESGDGAGVSSARSYLRIKRADECLGRDRLWARGLAGRDDRLVALDSYTGIYSSTSAFPFLKMKPYSARVSIKGL
jgi:hypothetical protein